MVAWAGYSLPLRVKLRQAAVVTANIDPPTARDPNLTHTTASGPSVTTTLDDPATPGQPSQEPPYVVSRLEISYFSQFLEEESPC